MFRSSKGSRELRKSSDCSGLSGPETGLAAGQAMEALPLPDPVTWRLSEDLKGGILHSGTVLYTARSQGCWRALGNCRVKRGPVGTLTLGQGDLNSKVTVGPRGVTHLSCHGVSTPAFGALSFLRK